MQLHHTSIKTADIFAAIAFYERLGFAVNERFTTGSTLACWMNGVPPGLSPDTRIELIQVPRPQPAADPFADEHYVGYYHLSFFVNSLDETLAQLGNVKMLLLPTLQSIGERHYRVSFVADPDGMPIELLEAVSNGTDISV
ncbi:MAG: VOC family protein [Cyanobacteria bacterium P01_A01_bin.3]